MPAAPTVVRGNRATNVGIHQDRRVVQMDDQIWDYDPNVSPMLSILAKRAPAVRSGNPEFKHLEDQPLPWQDLINNGAGYSATATSIVVDNGVYFTEGDLVLVVRTNEVMKVTAIASNTLTVVRGYHNDSVNGSAIVDNDPLAIIGNVNEEYGQSRVVKSTTEASLSNYCQIIRNSCGASETLGGSELYGMAERPRQRKKGGVEHAFRTERAFLFGRKRETTGPLGNRERATAGILNIITTIADNASGTLTAATLESWCEKLFRYGSRTKLVLASRRAGSQLDLIAEGRLQVVPEAETYGVKVRRFVSSHGELLVATHDMLVDFGGQGWAGYMIGVDMEYIRRRYMNDSSGAARLAQLKTERQLPDEDGWKDEYLSETGLHVVLENVHGILKGIV